MLHELLKEQGAQHLQHELVDQILEEQIDEFDELPHLQHEQV